MASGKTFGEVMTELYESLRASLGDQLDDPADEEWTRYKITFDAKLNDDAPPWIGTDHCG